MSEDSDIIEDFLYDIMINCELYELAEQAYRDAGEIQKAEIIRRIVRDAGLQYQIGINAAPVIIEVCDKGSQTRRLSEGYKEINLERIAQLQLLVKNAPKPLLPVDFEP